jgi:hypothetical protein
MQHFIPFTNLVLGQVLVNNGDCEAGLEALKHAEAEALSLEMRPILWQARQAMGQALEGLGQADEAEAKRSEARAVAEEIAGLFEDQQLRQAYLENVDVKT